MVGKRRVVFVALGVLGTTSAVFPSIIGKERGFYGKIELGFSREGWRYKDGYKLELDRTLFLQNYELGFNGYLLRPKLLHFDIKGGFRMDRSKYEGGGSESTTTLKGFDYSLNFRLFRGTSFPIHVFFSRTYTPSRMVAGNFQLDIDTKIEARGATVSFIRKNFFLTLSQTATDTQSVVEGISYNNDMDQRLATLSYTGAKGRLGLSYSEVKTRTFSPFYSYSEKNKLFSADLGYTEKTWYFSASGSYNSSLLGDYELFSESATFSYFPSTRFNLSISTNLNQYRGSIDTEYYAATEKISYRITDNWTLNQNASFYSLEDTSSASFGGGVAYSRVLTETLRVGFSTSGSYSKWMNGEKRDYYSYSISGDVDKRFPSIRSSIILDVAYSSLHREGKEASNTLSASEMLFIDLTRSTNFNHSLTYTKNSSKEYNYTYEMVRSGNSLSWKGRLLRRVDVAVRAGLDYWKFINTETESVKPYININGNFLATRRLSISFNVELYRDTLYDSEYALRSNMRMRYSFRKASIIWDNSFNREVIDDTFSYDRSSYHTSIRFVRTF